MGAAAVPLQIAGQGLQAYGKYREGQERSWALEDEARLQDRNAQIAREAGQYNANRQQLVADQRIGAMRANAAVSGVTSDSGSILDVLRQAHVNAEMDRLNILYGADMRVADASMRAISARQGAKASMDAGRFSAYSSLIAGAGQFAAMGGGGTKAPAKTASLAQDGPSLLDARNEIDAGGYA